MSTPGLHYNTFLTNNTFVYTGDTLPTDISIFNTTPNFSGSVSEINIITYNSDADWAPFQITGANTTPPGGNPYSYFAISLSGYFYAQETGSHTFYFENSNDITNDDVSYFYIGANALNPSSSNYTTATVFDNTGGTSNSYTTNLVAGTYYPILMYYGQSFGGAIISLGFSTPSVARTYNGAGYFFSESNPPVCFGEGAKILCYNSTTNSEELIPVEKLQKGTLVKTLTSGFQPVHTVAFDTLYNSGLPTRNPSSLYKLTSTTYPSLIDDLYLTGFHSILVDSITEEQRNKMIEIQQKIYVTEGKYRLLACVDDRCKPSEKEGAYTIWHFALENDHMNKNYGVWANGLLVETCPKINITRLIAASN